LPLVVQYSGRVCLLGEHCDWAGGASLTVPAPLSVVVAVDAPLSPD
jgi:galactokinase